MEKDPVPAQRSEKTEEEQATPVTRESDSQKLVRVKTSITLAPTPGKFIDERVIKFEHYNAFNYFIQSDEFKPKQLTIGITSPNEGEGKTLVATNLAVSLTVGQRRRTVLVDLNIRRPSIHRAFGSPISPGLIDALGTGTIHVTATQIDHLWIIPTGLPQDRRVSSVSTPASTEPSFRLRKEPSVNLDQLVAFRELIRSLEQEFEFVIVDMPAVNPQEFPILLAGELNGLIVVVDTKKTKRKDIEKMFRQVNKRQVLGFVLNRVTDEDL